MVSHIFSNHIICLTILTILTTISHKCNGAPIKPDESYVTKLTSPTPTHFVLVHGACHGGWSWYKVRALLESAGHKVSSPDLTSAGIDPSDANAIFTFQEYNKPVHDILTSLPEGEKVIIAGHSSGGISVSDAIQNFPEKILVGIYVVGEMQRNNSSHSEQEIEAEEPNLAKSTGLELLVDVFDYFYGQGRDNPPTSAIFKKEVQHELLYSKSPLEDSTLAAMLLKPCPIRATNKITDGSSKVPRVFIRTLHDKFFSLKNQDMLINNWPPSDVYDVDSDHCPMLSNPSQLFDVLIKVALKYSPRLMYIH